MRFNAMFRRSEPKSASSWPGCADRKWGQAYLTHDFFHRVGHALGDRVLLVVAYDDNRDGEMVAGALNFIGDTALYGRNWGCRPYSNYKNLHFELCYYQAIEAAIEMGLERVEAGAQVTFQFDLLTPMLHTLAVVRICIACSNNVQDCNSVAQIALQLQGQHKITRGYLPKATYSSHFVLNTTAAYHIRRYLQRSALQTEASIEALTAHASPFKVNEADLEGMLHRLMAQAAEQAK